MAHYNRDVVRILFPLGIVLIVLAIVLAFTIYSEIAGVLGVASLAAGVWATLHGRSHPTADT